MENNVPVYRSSFRDIRNFFSCLLFFFKDTKIDDTLFFVNKLGKGLPHILFFKVGIQRIFAVKNQTTHTINNNK